MHKRNLFIALAIVLVLFAASACVGAPDPVSTPVTTAEDEPTEEPTTEPTPTPESTAEVEQEQQVAQRVDFTFNSDILEVETREGMTWGEAEAMFQDTFLRVLAYKLVNDPDSEYAGMDWEKVHQMMVDGEITQIEDFTYPVVDRSSGLGTSIRTKTADVLDLTKPPIVTYTSVSAPEGELEEGMPDLRDAPTTALGSGLSFCIIEVVDGQLIVKLYGNPYLMNSDDIYNPLGIELNLTSSWKKALHFLYYEGEPSGDLTDLEGEHGNEDLLGLYDLVLLPGDELVRGVERNPVFKVVWPNADDYGDPAF